MFWVAPMACSLWKERVSLCLIGLLTIHRAWCMNVEIYSKTSSAARISIFRIEGCSKISSGISRAWTNLRRMHT